MRYPKFISPSALAKYKSSSEEYYLNYLADTPPPREPQTQPMSVGSAFDAYVKSYLFERVMGTIGPQFELDTIFEAQVEVQNRHFARTAGKICFDAYQSCGALADLLTELMAANDTPRFEFTVEGTVDGVPLLGKPDVWYVDRNGTPIILDFKVNGYCSSYPTSPKRGYVRVRPGEKGSHKAAQISKVGGLRINIAEFLEAIDSTWAQQLATYAWLCGAECGSFFVVAIDQLCCSPGGDIRVAEHRCQIGPDFQRSVLKSYKELWSLIHSSPFHFFTDRTISESVARCGILDKQFASYVNGESWLGDMFK
jgi:hypothetical protein